MNTLPLATDFANLLAARRLFVGKGAHHEADYGRQRVARWIANVSAPQGGKIEVNGAVRRFIPQTLRNPEPIFYLHGGGLVYYSTEVFSSFLSLLANVSGREIRAFDYPKAPETPMADIVSHLEQHLTDELGRVDAPPCLMGDSVGGLLALWFAASFHQAFSRLCLLYPVLADHHDFDSFQRYGEGYLLDAVILRWFAEHWLPWCRQQRFNPLAPDFAFDRLPPVVLHTAGYDVLADEGLAFAAHARQAGRALLQHHHHPALPHDFCLYVGKLASSRQAVEHIARTLDAEHTFIGKQ